MKPVSCQSFHRLNRRPGGFSLLFLVIALTLLCARTGAAASSTRSNSESDPDWLARHEPYLTEGPTGLYRFPVTETSPLSTLKVLTERLKIDIDDTDGAGAGYDPLKLPFHAYVPDGHEPGKPAALLVWISPVQSALPPVDYIPVLQNENCLWIGASNLGNDAPTPLRFFSAIDAAIAMQKAWDIPADRVFVAGMSGGGRLASALAILYPEVFGGGGYFIIGANPQPEVDEALLEQARSHRFLFLTGSKDYNRTQMRDAYKEYMRKGFADCRFFSIRGMAHAYPSAEHFAEGLRWLLREE
ncbi:MAG TPA: PHB depolymerase family esterase [Oceanipulchritudo sp.]|nr:PHB depolymerase family esterase [Oceanipulchritudo sp.]